MLEVSEKMYFFEGSRRRKLLGFLHVPRQNRLPVGIVYCHPFAEEKNCSHAVTVKAARAFAEQGFAVFRFDFSGCGDSEGDLEDVRLEDWRRDIEGAIMQLKIEVEVQEVAMWGLRLGTGLALLHAAERADIPFIILWQPLVDFKQYIHQFLRQGISTGLAAGETDLTSVQSLVAQLQSGGTVEVIGYPIIRDLYNSFIAIGDAPKQVGIKGAVFIAAVSMMDAAPWALTKWIEQLKTNTPHLHFSHIHSESFWDRYWCWDSPTLVQQTVDWLKVWKQNGKTGSV